MHGRDGDLPSYCLPASCRSVTSKEQKKRHEVMRSSIKQRAPRIPILNNLNLNGDCGIVLGPGSWIHMDKRDAILHLALYPVAPMSHHCPCSQQPLCLLAMWRNSWSQKTNKKYLPGDVIIFNIITLPAINWRNTISQWKKPLIVRHTRFSNNLQMLELRWVDVVNK